MYAHVCTYTHTKHTFSHTCVHTYTEHIKKYPNNYQGNGCYETHNTFSFTQLGSTDLQEHCIPPS